VCHILADALPVHSTQSLNRPQNRKSLLIVTTARRRVCLSALTEFQMFCYRNGSF